MFVSKWQCGFIYIRRQKWWTYFSCMLWCYYQMYTRSDQFSNKCFFLFKSTRSLNESVNFQVLHFHPELHSSLMQCIFWSFSESITNSSTLRLVQRRKISGFTRNITRNKSHRRSYEHDLAENGYFDSHMAVWTLTWYLLIHAGIRNTFGWMDFE